MKIVNSGRIPIDPGEFETLMTLLTESVCEVILPPDLAAGVTHWWKLTWRGQQSLYIGTPDSFRLWKQSKTL